MLRLFNFFFPVLFSTLLFAGCVGKRAVGNEVPEADVSKAISDGNWRFTVIQVMPAIGRNQPANGDYTVDYSGNKLVVYLPYFGRATGGGVDAYSGRGPLDFTAENVAISKEHVKPGEWHIQIRPDNREVQVMDFTLYNNRRGHLSVRLNNRSAISYTGSVTSFLSK